MSKKVKLDKGMLPNKEQIYNDWQNACENVNAYTEEVYAVTVELAVAKAVLKTARFDILTKTDPKELGSNEAQREANLFLRTEKDFNAVTRLEERHARASQVLELAKLEKDRVREVRRICLGTEGVA